MSRIFRLAGDKVEYLDKQGIISKQGDVTLLTSHERYKTHDKIFDADKYTMYRIGGYQQYCAGVRTYNLTEIDGTPTDIDEQIKRIDEIGAGVMLYTDGEKTFDIAGNIISESEANCSEMPDWVDHIFLDRAEGKTHKGHISLGLLITSDPFFVGERIIRVADGKIFVVTGNKDFSNGVYRSTVERYNGNDEILQEILYNYRKEHECKVPAHDAVEHPAHYETGKFECIDVMIETQGVEAVKDFCICNAFKYLYRHGRKNGAEDIKKAIWYLKKWVELNDGTAERGS